MTESEVSQFPSDEGISVQVNHVFERIIQRCSRRDSEQWPTLSGFEYLNEVISDTGGELFAVIIGAPGMGRTALVSQMFMEAQRPGHRLFFSIDLKPEMLLTRWLHSTARVDGNRIRTGQLNERDFERLAKAADYLAHSDFTLVDAYDFSVDQMVEHAREIAGNSPLGVIAVDGLELLVDEDIDAAVLKLRRLSREMECAVLVTLPVNTQNLNLRVSKRPLLSDLTISQAVQGAADLVLGIYRDEFYNPETQWFGVMELAVLKQKHGPLATVKVQFHSSHVRINSLLLEET